MSYILLGDHHGVLGTEVLANITLVVADNGFGGELPALLGRERCGPKAQGDVAHGHDDNTLVRRRVLSDAPKTPLQHVVSVKERHLCAGLDPNLNIKKLKQKL